MTYYVSGPMTGYPANNTAAFDRACALLRDRGYQVVSPHEKVSEALGLTWEEYLREDIRHLLDCYGVVMLPGWPESKGARLELSIALALGMPVYYLCLDAGTLTRMSRTTDAAIGG